MDAHSDPEIGKSVQANGLKTNYLEQGGGFPVILLHGSGPGVTGYANWRFALPVLAQNFRAIAPDAAGFGYTERKSNTDYTLDYWIDHIVAFMDALNVPKAHLVGNSFGGALALAITARHPERVDRLVLMEAWVLVSILPRPWTSCGATSLPSKTCAGSWTASRTTAR